MAVGICYELAFNAVTRGTVDHFIPDVPPEFGTPRLELVHGFPTGCGGDAKGRKFCHAWVEIVMAVPGVAGKEFVYAVIDVGSFASHKPQMLPQQVYYRAGSIVEGECTRYTEEEALEMALEHEHYGPWIPESEFPKGVIIVRDTEGKA